MAPSISVTSSCQSGALLAHLPLWQSEATLIIIMLLSVTIVTFINSVQQRSRLSYTYFSTYSKNLFCILANRVKELNFLVFRFQWYIYNAWPTILKSSKPKIILSKCRLLVYKWSFIVYFSFYIYILKT